MPSAFRVSVHFQSGFLFPETTKRQAKIEEKEVVVLKCFGRLVYSSVSSLRCSKAVPREEGVVRRMERWLLGEGWGQLTTSTVRLITFYIFPPFNLHGFSLKKKTFTYIYIYIYIF